MFRVLGKSEYILLASCNGKKVLLHLIHRKVSQRTVLKNKTKCNSVKNNLEVAEEEGCGKQLEKKSCKSLTFHFCVFVKLQVSTKARQTTMILHVSLNITG